MSNYCVYYHRNLLNNKLYIGISKNVKVRWKNDGKSYKECKYFYRAIQKYGWNNFEHIVLINDISKELACIIEKELIKKYNTQNSNYGYNIASGGFGGCTVKGSLHHNSKKVYQYDLQGNFIQEWENAQRASEKLKISVSDIHVMCRNKEGIRKAGNYMWSYFKVDHMIPYVREGHSKNSILQIDKDFNIICEYKNISYIDSLLYDKEKVTMCCKKQNISHKNFYWVYKDIYDKDSFIEYLNERKKSKCSSSRKEIQQCDLTGNVINIFKSAKDAEEKTGINRGTVQAYCKRPEMNNGIHTGYIWKYA